MYLTFSDWKYVEDRNCVFGGGGIWRKLDSIISLCYSIISLDWWIDEHDWISIFIFVKYIFNNAICLLLILP